MNSKIARLSFLFLSLFAPLLYAQNFALSGSDLMLEDNHLDLSYSDDKTIAFIKATYFPGEGFSESYSLDIGEKIQDIHGIGIVTTKSIASVGENAYLIKSYARLPILVKLGKTSIVFEIGSERYSISKSGHEFAIEVGSREAANDLGSNRKLRYRLTDENAQGFLGIAEKTYMPKYDGHKAEDLDVEAIYVPKEFTLLNGSLKASTYQIEGNDYPIFEYKYTFPMAKEKAINLKNYLILLTQRRDSAYIPLIHPVLLTIYFYDAIMPAP